MARNAAVAVENNFSKGLITEASGLNFPENAAQETYDCIFLNTGEVTRRNGFAMEVGGVQNTVTSDLSAVAEYNWNNAANLGDVSIVVQQIGTTLYFFKVPSSGALSAGKIPSTINLATFAAPGAPISPAEGKVCQFADGNGVLFVAHPYCNPFYVEYDSGQNTVSATALALKIRDFRRLDDGLENNERPNTESNLHKYNLYNQGWYISAATTSGTENVLDYFKAKKGVYASNADQWWLFKNADEKMDSANIDKINRGNSTAPNGHYIVDAFNIDRTAVSGIAGIDVESASFHRPQTVAHYGGRVFWGGCAFMGFGDKIYFSPVLEDVDDAAHCYQQQDPTAEDDSDLLPSDGGVIVIPGMGVLIKLYALGTQLLAFASNGIWQIGGSTGSGFAANDYSIRKVSTHQSAGPMSFVEAEGILFWWNVNGIYILQPNQVTQDYQAVSISDPTIKTFIATIPSANIKYVKGAYNPEAQVIQWLFRSKASQSSADLFRYDRILNFRASLQAFYPWKITTALEFTGSPDISGIIATSGFGTADVDEAIVLLDGNVVVIDPDSL